MTTEASIRNAVRYTFYAEADPDGIVDRFIEEVRAEVAREIENVIPTEEDLYDLSWAAGLYDAARIAREGGRTDD